MIKLGITAKEPATMTTTTTATIITSDNFHYTVRITRKAIGGDNAPAPVQSPNEIKKR